jgi:signal peptidase II
MGMAIFFFSRKQIRKYNLFLNAALSCMFGGGVGNMIDRIFNESVNPVYAEKGSKVVVDFLEFDFVNFAVFNLADTFICIGSVLFCVCVFTGKYKLALFGEKTINKEDKEENITEENI